MKIYDCVPGLEFDESVDFNISPAWFQDATHSVPPLDAYVRLVLG